MNISRIVKKVLLEQEVKPVDKKINLDDQFQILNLGLKAGCIKNSENTSIKTMSNEWKKKHLPHLDGENIPFIRIDDFIYTGQVNKDLTDKSKEGTVFYGFKIVPGKVVEVTQGWGHGCAVLSSVNKLGYDTLSDEEYTYLKKFLEKNKNYSEAYKDNTSEWKKISLKDLRWQDGSPVIPNYDRGGYVWKSTGSMSGSRIDHVGHYKNILDNQGITTDENLNSFMFYWGDIKNDFMAKNIQIEDNTKLWVKELPEPEKNICRKTIKKLHGCMRKSSIVSDCYTNNIKDKITAMQCSDKRFIGGIIGIKDEYEELKNNRGPFGLFKLLRRRGNQSAPIIENIKDKINKKLNEQYKKLNKI